MAGKWNKYNVKSLKVPKGKDESQYYDQLIKQFPKEKADEIYKRFKYQITHGQNFTQYDTRNNY